MMDIRVRTVNKMQGSQASFIILYIVVTEKTGFLRVRNRANVACTRAQDGMIIVGDVDQLLTLPKCKRLHFRNVFDHIAKHRGVYRPKADVTEPRNEHVPLSLTILLLTS